jgi:hypothetical protein
VLLAAIIAAAWWIATPRPPIPQPSEPRLILNGDLCNNVFRDRVFGYQARVVFRYALQPTDDPRVWLYHPGHPPQYVAETIRIEFTDPTAPMTSPTVVLGTVDRVIPDDRARASRHLGVVVITGCKLEPQ